MGETFEASVDVSEETQEVAEPVESVETETANSTESTEGEEVQESTDPVVDRNSEFAAARRKAEAEIKSRDAEFVRRFGHLNNPITGKPVRSEKDYLEALDAQETLKRNQVLQEKGIDPSIIDQAIANNPIVRQAEQVIAQSQNQQIQNTIEAELKMINSLDPSVKSFADLDRVADKEAMLSMVQRGYSLYDAFRLANYDNLLSKKSAAAEQKAINQAKGKSHLTPTSSGAKSNDGLEDIPADKLDKWKAFFPNASAKELKEKYNRSRKS